MLRLALCIIILGLLLPITALHGCQQEKLSAQQILNKGIAALGGKAKLGGLKGVTSHA